ncbi:hypothetical protein L202_02514 [Cryptococcus amylolentus CBS 6039]|uniref:Uncharacterized protein n=1 Tax=Cryptococcus amylolentus CBS 6039 TaxID=1295533 RepID=A0A1E3I0W1_9TREE|nr:hypothetical protein L202_02514 [Cryptococcus amylolentus CBS 6039]ODN82229.1 hypothetical protein L202_02514 [Cryptococcus amylolentus CBS 6039]
MHLASASTLSQRLRRQHYRMELHTLAPQTHLVILSVRIVHSIPLPSALCPLPSALCPLPSALCPLPSALCPLPSALCPLPSALCPLPEPEPEPWHQPQKEGREILTERKLLILLCNEFNSSSFWFSSVWSEALQVHPGARPFHQLSLLLILPHAFREGAGEGEEGRGGGTDLGMMAVEVDSGP